MTCCALSFVPDQNATLILCKGSLRFRYVRQFLPAGMNCKIGLGCCNLVLRKVSVERDEISSEPGKLVILYALALPPCLLRSCSWPHENDLKSLHQRWRRQFRGTAYRGLKFSQRLYPRSGDSSLASQNSTPSSSMCFALSKAARRASMASPFDKSLIYGRCLWHLLVPFGGRRSDASLKRPSEIWSIFLREPANPHPVKRATHGSLSKKTGRIRLRTPLNPGVDVLEAHDIILA